ncbi:ubiquinol-cytochrome c reductase complex ubiquinone-binding protein [Hyaloscypha hepaticicola]|uniref:Cytochrome b-c1 complex subunit 8 n=1 Tax=Hyaloscypha hepaticicola TaxID=2082293 RepID=A0A2J6QCG1_9HELO|nr:ubiquinol-cytochrome c reductase complex ubiquinone-binding protein [Hyaloscypha hepaticicola]
MRPSQIMRSGGDGEIGKYGKYLGGWGNFGSQTQKGIASYALSANRQRPLAGALNNAIFNSWRRFRNQVLYFAPPIVIGYYAINWAIERNHYLNSKEGRLEFGEEE